MDPSRMGRGAGRRPLRILAFFGAFLCAASALARPEWLDDDYLLDRWTNADGLPVNGTTDVHLGRRGYLWLATFDGLVRFDGYGFRTFDASSHPNLPGNRLTRLVQHDDGLIWVLTEQYALASFDGTQFHAAGVDQGLPADRVLKLHLDGDDRLWIGTDNGLARACGATCFRTVDEDRLAADGVQAFADAIGGGIWAGTGSGAILRVRPEGDAHAVRTIAGLGLSDIRALLVDSDGVLWAGGRGGLARIEEGRGEMLPAFAGEVVNDLELAPNGDVIAQSYDRAYRRGENGWRVVNEGPIAGYVRLVAAGPAGSEWRVRQSELLRDGRPVVRASCPISDFEFDSTGGVWLATLCDGLWRVAQRQFQTIARRQGLPEGPVYGIVQDEHDALWASVGSGFVAEIRDRQVSRLHEAGSPAQVVGTVATDQQGNIWVGKGSVCRMSDSGCQPPPNLPDALRQELVRAIFEDASGALWVGSGDGLWRRFKGRWQNMQQAVSLPEWVQVQTIMQAEDGNLWFGTDSSGLRRRSPDGGVERLDSASGLSSDRIRDLHEDEWGRLWVVTADSGLCRSGAAESASGLTFTCLGKREGLYSNSLHRLLADEQGRYWFNSNSGVFWVHREALERVLDGESSRVYPRVYTEGDGLPDREGNGGVQNAGIRLGDGRLAFPGQGGIVIFDPARIEALAGTPRVVLERIRLPGGADLAAGETVRMPQGERIFSVRFTGIQPGLADQTYFRYRMNGGRWLEIGEDRNLSFDGVQPGRHQLEIAAVDADSGLSGPTARMNIVVPPFFHERMDVRVGIAILVAAVLALWVIRRRRAAIRLQQYLHREVERRTADAVRQQRIAERALSEAGRARSGDEPQREERRARARPESTLADRVRAWVESRVHEGNVSVARLAEALFMSRSKLHRLLVEETGRSPGEFIRDVRLGMARQMLQEDSASVSDVAYAVGFSSVSGFSRAYSSHFGEAPSDT